MSKPEVWWHMHVILAFGRWRLEDQELKVTLGYIRPCFKSGVREKEKRNRNSQWPCSGTYWPPQSAYRLLTARTGVGQETPPLPARPRPPPASPGR